MMTSALQFLFFFFSQKDYLSTKGNRMSLDGDQFCSGIAARAGFNGGFCRLYLRHSA